jgi:mono/diheme cytochrome c family protein
MKESSRLRSLLLRHARVGRWAWLLAASAGPALAAADAGPVTFEKNVAPLLQKYCYECHGDGKHKGDVTLDADQTLAAVHQGAKKWETVMERVRSLEMPPDDADRQPSAAERELISGWIEKELFHVDPANPDPGRVTIHRLNRNEYNNTIRDLVGVDFQPADDFPADNSGYGFDNISSVLSLPPVLLEKYLTAARRITDEAIPTEQRQSKVQKFRANLMEVGFNAEGDNGSGFMPLGSLEEDNLAVRLPFTAGDYIIRVNAYATPKGKYASSNKPLAEQPVVLTYMLDEAILGEWKITAPDGKPETYEMRVGLPAGRRRLAIVNHHMRGGDNETQLKNGRVGVLQGGTVYVKNIEIEGPLPTATVRVPAAKLAITGEGKFLSDGGRVLEHAGEVALTHRVPAEGEYLLRAQASAEQAGSELARMEFRIDGQAVHTFDVVAHAKLQVPPGQRLFSAVLLNAAPQVYEFKVKLPPGEHRFAAAFINDFADPENKNPNLRDRNLIIDHLEIASLTEPARLPSRPELMEKLFAQAATPPAPTGLSGAFARLTGRTAPPPAPAAQARTVVGEFARRAWRRPVDASEVDELMRLYTAATAEGASFEAGVKVALQAVLVSPNFLFRGEFASGPIAATSTALGRPVSEFALASRLSYFLWSSMPDDELLALAGRGELRKNLETQVRRMIASPKARALVTNFAGQWLEIRNLKFVAPDSKTFPDFDETLRTAMQVETETFFEHIVREDRSVLEFLTADYTYINERLAKHYGLAGVTGDEFRRVSLAGTPRRGVLTQASVLTITSNPTRTSPVKRGKWVLEDLLGTPPPPPPPNVPDLPNDGKPVAGTLRHQMEQHRANPTCASCHARMDPIGFGLENFDAIGAYRTKDGEFPVDAAGKLSTGESFATAAELTGILSDKRRENFIRNLAEKTLIYSLGRGIERSDRPAVDRIMQEVTTGNYRFSALVLAVVKSVPFDQQRIETPVAMAAK